MASYLCKAENKAEQASEIQSVQRLITYMTTSTQILSPNIVRTEKNHVNVIHHRLEHDTFVESIFWTWSKWSVFSWDPLVDCVICFTLNIYFSNPQLR